MGIIEVTTPAGNIVKAYDIERCLCDVLRGQGDDIQIIQFAMKKYAASKDKDINKLIRYVEIITHKEKLNNNYLILFNNLFEFPIISKKEAAEKLGVSQGTANTMIDKMCELGILQDHTPHKKRYKNYIFNEYFEILRRGTDL